MKDIFENPDDDATPLAPDEKRGLLPDFVGTRADLNRVEQQNIIQGARWAYARKRNVLDVNFLCKLHQQMFGSVWDWAGTFRTSARNIGIEAAFITVSLHNMIEDVKTQIQYQSYPPDEIVARFHHRLVAIHPFPNGNGRFSRLATDLLARQMGIELFTWGDATQLTAATDTRKAYIEALKAADGHDFAPLLAYLRPPV